jgi:hypothetical protein
MAETKWNPGPWRMVDAPGGTSIGTRMISVVDAAGDVICDDDPKHPTPVPSIPTARLIAAAPTMYEALAEARSHILLLIDGPCDPDDDDVLRQIDAALAAATGETTNGR